MSDSVFVNEYNYKDSEHGQITQIDHSNVLLFLY